MIEKAGNSQDLEAEIRDLNRKALGNPMKWVNLATFVIASSQSLRENIIVGNVDSKFPISFSYS